MHLRPATVVTTLGAIAATAIVAPREAGAATLEYVVNGADGPFAAEARFVFDDSGATTTLDVQLRNVGGTDERGNQWLTGLFFDLAGSPTLAYSGLGGDAVDGFNDLVDRDLDPYAPVNGEDAAHYWGLAQDAQTNLAGVGGQAYALHAAGFHGLGTGVLDEVPGVTTGVGRDGGIVNGAANIPGNVDPYVFGGLWLTFDLGDYDLSAAAISNVLFHYGTDASQPGFAGDVTAVVPVPPAAALGVVGLGVVGLRRRRG